MMQFLTLTTEAEEAIATQTPILIGCIIIGWLSVILMQIITLSQAVTIYKTRNTAAISIWTYVLFGVSSIIGTAWAYCYYTKQICSDAGIALLPGPGGQLSIDVLNALRPLAQWSIIPLIFYNVFNIVCAVWITVIKSRSIRLATKMKCSELQVSYFLLKKQKSDLIASHYKLHNRKYFNLVLILSLNYLFAIAICAITCLFFVRNDVDNLFHFSGQFFWENGIMIISIVTSFVTEAFSWPTFINVLKKRDTSGMSFNWAIFTPVTLTVSFLYALTLASAEVAAGGWASFPPDTIGALIFNGLIVNYGILILKQKNRKMAKKLHMSETTYTEKILVPEYERKIEARKEVERLIQEQEQKIALRQGNLEKLKKQNERRESYQEKRIQEEQDKLQQMKKKTEMKKKQEEIFQEKEKKYKSIRKRHKKSK